MKKIEKPRTGEHPSAIPLLARRGFRTTALITVLAVMPALVFTGCKQGGDKEVNIEWYDDDTPPDIPPDGNIYARFSGFPENTDYSVIDAIKAKAEDDELDISLMGYTTEKITFNDDDSDLGKEGLILCHDGDNITSPNKVIIDGNGAMITLTGGNTENVPLITVGKGVTLTLQSITFQGTKYNTAPLIKVEEGGTLIMADHNTKIIGNKYNGNGGGVYVDNGVLEMRDGEISDNEAQNGGGVYVEGANGRFEMYGGNVHDNTAQCGGGVYVDNGRVETVMADIRDNIATDKGGGVYVNTGGTFETMIGTAIDSNTATNAGGGVYVNGTFRMDSGDVKGNNVTNKNGNGGGVYVDNGGRFNMEAGGISGNSIYRNDIGPPFPQYNPASDGKGPGVYVRNGGTLSKTGGVIFGAIDSNENAWEVADFQNYYMYSVYNPDTGGPSEYAVTPIDADDIPWGSAQIGYAVYREKDKIIINKTDNGE